MEKKNINWDKIFNFAYYFLLVLLIIWLICFRTEIWLHKAAFFHDEAALLKNIQERSFLDLFKTLDYVQCCPAFFLIFNKIVYNIYGLNEVALCFLPYIAGVFSIILIPFLSNKIFKHKAISLLFLVLFAYHPHLTIASQTFKQYSTDVFCTILLLYLFFTFKDKIKTSKHFALTGIIFGLFGYISFTSEFIMFPMFIYFIYKLIKDENIKSIVFLTLPYILLLGTEFLLLKNTYGNEMNNWQDFETIISSYNVFSSTITLFVCHIFNQKLILVLLIIGVITLCLKEKLLAFILFAPIVLNIITQIFGIYPFPDTVNNRIILYIAPLLMIIFLKSAEIISFILKSDKPKYIISTIAILATIFFLHFVLRTHFLLNKTYIGHNNYYYFIMTNVKEYISHLDSIGTAPNDIIIIDKMGHVSFNLYSNNKYQDNAIYLADDLIPLDEIKEGSKIWLYNTQYICCSNEWMKMRKDWIYENCEILIHKKDDMGELFYVKKIK